MDISDVKNYLGKKVIYNDPRNYIENLECVFRAYRLAYIRGKKYHQAELEEFHNNNCVMIVPLEMIRPFPDIN